MAKGMSRAHEEHLRELLQASPVARDALPYMDDFAELKRQFYDRTFKELSDQEFWAALVSTAKGGGVRGKARARGGPDLTEDDEAALARLLPLPIGQRDRLPYTEKFDRLVARLN